MIVALAIKSLRNRRFTATLTVLSIALSVTLLLGVERIRAESRASFANAVSGTDLIVGARTSPVNLLLASVFRIGDATNNIGWDSYRRIAARPDVAWTIPLSLGDSHRGFRVLGTTADYFDHFRFGEGRPLAFAAGRPFAGDRDAVLGAEVARALDYPLGRSFVIAHGAGDVGFAMHESHPFRVAGILARTGTPVDRAIHVSLEGVDAVHAKQSDDPLAAALEAARGGHDDASHRAITAFFVGLKSRSAAPFVQRQISEFADEPLTAILPGATLQDVWEIARAAEKTLVALSMLVVVMGFASMLIALLTSLGERRREMAVLRAVGARPWQIFALILGEAAFLTLAGIAVGVASLLVGLRVAQHWLEQRLGLFVPIAWPSGSELGLVATVAMCGMLVGLIPAWRIYRQSLADGMTMRV